MIPSLCWCASLLLPSGSALLQLLQALQALPELGALQLAGLQQALGIRPLERRGVRAAVREDDPRLRRRRGIEAQLAQELLARGQLAVREYGLGAAPLRPHGAVGADDRAGRQAGDRGLLHERPAPLVPGLRPAALRLGRHAPLLSPVTWRAPDERRSTATRRRRPRPARGLLLRAGSRPRCWRGRSGRRPRTDRNRACRGFRGCTPRTARSPRRRPGRSSSRGTPGSSRRTA